MNGIRLDIFVREGGGGGDEHSTLFMHPNGKLGDKQLPPLIDTKYTIVLKVVSTVR